MSTAKPDDKAQSRTATPKFDMNANVIVRRYIPMAIVFLSALIMMSDYYVTGTIINTTALNINSFVTVIMAFLMVLGTIGTYLRHIRNVRRKGRRWYMSAYAIIFLTVVVIMGTGLGLTNSTYQYFYTNFYSWPDLSVASLHAFGTVTCILYAVRCRNLEEILFAIGALFGYLMLSTVGAAASPYIVQVGQWIADQPFIGATRAITIVMAIGMFGSGLRTMLARRGSGAEFR